MGRDEAAQRVAVGQVQQHLDRAVQGVELADLFLAEGTVVGHLGQAALFAQAIQDLAELGARFEPGLVQPPQIGIGLVERVDPAVRPEHGDGGGKRFEHLVQRGLGG